MAPTPLQQRRTHNSLLFQKLLNLRDGASPFTLVLDSLEQSGVGIVREFGRRAKISKSKIIFISFATLSKKVPIQADVFVSAIRKDIEALRAEVVSHFPPPQAAATSPTPQKTLVIIDTLNPLSSKAPAHLSSFLSSLLQGPWISLLATYHLDVPVSHPASSGNHEYLPDPLTTLQYLATAILEIENLSHVVLKKKARDRSLAEPVFGLAEGKEGVIVSSPATRSLDGGTVIRMEIRRKSGRGVRESFVFYPPSSPAATNTKTTTSTQNLGTIILLDDHPSYSPPDLSSGTTKEEEGGEEAETTFKLGLTEKQKKDREGVILPYFDAQKDGGGAGPGDGGRILYEMGEEDREDFDDEEDEI